MDEPQTEHSAPMHTPRTPVQVPSPPDPLAHPAELARDIVAGRQLGIGVGLEASLQQRFDTSGAPGLHAARFGQRFAARALRAAPLDLTVSPYAPPQRQLSVARQGAPMWRPPGAAPLQGQAAAQHESNTLPVAEASTPRAQPQAADELPADLRALLDLHRARQRI